MHNLKSVVLVNNLEYLEAGIEATGKAKRDIWRRTTVRATAQLNKMVFICDGHVENQIVEALKASYLQYLKFLPFVNNFEYLGARTKASGKATSQIRRGSTMAPAKLNKMANT